MFGTQPQQRENYVEKPPTENITIQKNNSGKTFRLNSQPIENQTAYDFPKPQ
jgi:hypothetical protein